MLVFMKCAKVDKTNQHLQKALIRASEQLQTPLNVQNNDLHVVLFSLWFPVDPSAAAGGTY